MRTEKLNKIVEGLCKVSEKHYINPFDQLKWPETVDRNNWFTRNTFGHDDNNYCSNYNRNCSR